jgi:TetR/AcrR family fatty acid metabolism transcriptional regulator
MRKFHFEELKNNPDLAKVLSQEGGGLLHNKLHVMKNDSFGVPKIFQKMLNESKQKGGFYNYFERFARQCQREYR